MHTLKGSSTMQANDELSNHQRYLQQQESGTNATVNTSRQFPPTAATATTWRRMSEQAATTSGMFPNQSSWLPVNHYPQESTPGLAYARHTNAVVDWSQVQMRGPTSTSAMFPSSAGFPANLPPLLPPPPALLHER